MVHYSDEPIRLILSLPPNLFTGISVMPNDIEIARQCKLKPIGSIAGQLGIDVADLEPYGHFKAKL
ncbi:formate--tetrahydrofolate ligase, partial [bacterium]|nr:formate--tetrahydrofolate ligase [bacterium]